MAIMQIDGLKLERMLKNGLANLKLHEEEINRLNVFPVPDGDTGVNMWLTLENGLKAGKRSHHVGAYLRTVSEGMLYGARGNSGVILSQFFYGFAVTVRRCPLLGPGEIRNALIRGYRAAYAAVVKPEEGTMLTVMREGIEHIRGAIVRSSTLDSIFSMYVAEMKKSLKNTTDLLPQLKEANVVDSGAAGYIYIAEGMLKYLWGERIKVSGKKEENLSKQDASKKILAETAGKKEIVSKEVFNEYSPFSLGYCMEFILQLMYIKPYDRYFQKDRYIEDLKLFGESIVVAAEDTRIKVHIHTFRPEKIISLSREYGEFVTFKLENMQIQHNSLQIAEKSSKKEPHKKFAIVSLVNGEGLQKVMKDLGCDEILDGGATMNASAQEIVEAVKRADADVTVILPNHSNMIPAAMQAAELMKNRKVHVIPTKTVAEGYAALGMDIRDSEDIESRIRRMNAGFRDVTTLFQTVAEKDCLYHGISCGRGDEITLQNGEPVCVEKEWKTCFIRAMENVEDMESKEVCVVFAGANATEEDCESLTALLSEKWPCLEVSVLSGGQSIYRFIAGIW